MPLTMSWRHLAALLLVTVIWGVNFVVVKVGLAQMPPIAFVALRFLVVALILLPLIRRPPRFGPVLAVATTLGVVHFSLMFLGLRSLDAATAAIAIQLQVPFAALLAALLLNDRLGWRRLLGMAVAFAGVALIAGEPRFEGGLLPLALVVCAACVWAMANIQIKQLGDAVDVLSLNGWIALLATPQLFVVSALFEEGQIAAILSADWRVWGSVFYQVLLVTVLGYGIWYHIMRRYSVNQVMPFTLLVPLFGVASGVIFLGERLTVPMLIGGGATILGVAIIVLRRPRMVAPATKSGL